MSLIHLNNIRVYAYHGCLAEEAIIGGNYIVDVTIDADFSVAIQSDDLKDTVDYCEVFEIVKEQMKIRSKLIEHVAYRIGVALKNKMKAIKSVEVKITKIAAPLNGDVASVAFTLTV